VHEKNKMYRNNHHFDTIISRALIIEKWKYYYMFITAAARFMCMHGERPGSNSWGADSQLNPSLKFPSQINASTIKRGNKINGYRTSKSKLKIIIFWLVQGNGE
jgi:hypothetical protein